MFIVLLILFLQTSFVVPSHRLRNQGPCSSGFFHCSKTDNCIDARFECDTNIDCEFGEDEAHCNANTECESNLYNCNGTDVCLDIFKKCDGILDCPAGKLYSSTEENIQQLHLFSATNHFLSTDERSLLRR